MAFDPAQVSYEDLLKVFVACHDAGARRSAQYRSAVFWTTPGQRDAAAAFLKALKGRSPVATELAQASTFWRAEEYHQHYNERHGAACGR